jgi:hypothetical protein
MNPYTMLGSGFGTNEAMSLTARLSAWHDAMVAHERRLRNGTTSDRCDDDCPHAEARGLWSEAVATFGPRANELAFLCSRGKEATRRKADAAPREEHSDAADRVGRTRTTRGNTAAESLGDRRPAAEL